MWPLIGSIVDSIPGDSPVVAVVSWLVTGGVAGFAGFLWRRMENLYQQASEDHQARIDALKADNEQWQEQYETERSRMLGELDDHRTRLRSTEKALREAELRAHECELRNMELSALVERLREQVDERNT